MDFKDFLKTIQDFFMCSVATEDNGKFLKEKEQNFPPRCTNTSACRPAKKN